MTSPYSYKRRSFYKSKTTGARKIKSCTRQAATQHHACNFTTYLFFRQSIRSTFAPFRLGVANLEAERRTRTRDPGPRTSGDVPISVSSNATSPSKIHPVMYTSAHTITFRLFHFACSVLEQSPNPPSFISLHSF